MKRLIALLRISGLTSFLLFLLITAMVAKISITAQLFMIISVLSFACIVVIQLYRFYIRNYMRE